EPWRIFAQYMGRADGPTKGRDGNVHMADSNLGLIAMVSHLPAMLPVAVGCALAFRIREEKRVAVGWFGEGASARGDCHEAMTLAGVRKLPVVFICDNNQCAYSTPTHLEFATEHVADRAWVRDVADMSDEEEEEVGADVKKALNDALERAEDAPLPEPSSLTEGVYASPEDLDTPRHK